MKKDKKFFYFLIVITEISLFFISLFILYIQKIYFKNLFFSNYNLLLNIFSGIFAGIISGILSFILVYKINFFYEIKKIIHFLVFNFNLNIFDIFFISIMAGFFEEILFRGILQNYLGIYITSFIFILLHGYFNPFNINITIFGFIMFFISLILGFVKEYIGLLSAMSFHFSFDFIVLFCFLYFYKRDKGNEKNSS